MEQKYITFSRVEKGMPRIISSTPFSDEQRGRTTHCAVVRLPYPAQANGLPRQGELPKVSELDDQLVLAMMQRGAIHAGHVVGNGEVKSIFYGADVLPESIEFRTGIFKKARFPIENSHDPQWHIYELDLAPTLEDVELHESHALFENLEKHGDIASIPREVDFTCIFPSAAQRSSFVEDAHAAGFEMKKDTWDEGGQFFCDLNKTTRVEREIMARECATLRALIKKHGGDFDGWGCPIRSQ